MLMVMPLAVSASAAPPCSKNPTHPRCVPATPTPPPTPTPTIAPTPTPTLAPTPTPTLAPTPTPTVAPTPTPTVAPTPTATPANSVRVTSIAALKTALANNAITEIVVANGTYTVAQAHTQGTNALWIGSAYAGRTNPVTVRAETKGGVTFDGGGANTWGGMSFEDGAHHQTWDGFNFNNGIPTQTGVIVFGGYNLPAAHHITLRNITMMSGIRGTAGAEKFDHMIYFSNSGSHDILIEDYTVNNPAQTVSSALQFHHDPNSYNVVVRRMHVVGTENAVLIYTGTLRDTLIEDSDIRGAELTALNINQTGANVIIKNTTSENGVYFPSGQPAGLRLVNSTFAGVYYNQ
jgi:hypothetical protein